MKRVEVRVPVTVTALVAVLGAAGFAAASHLGSTEAGATDGRGGGLRPLIVRDGTVTSRFDSEDGLYPGHNADISMDVTSIVPAVQAPRPPRPPRP